MKVKLVLATATLTVLIIGVLIFKNSYSVVYYAPSQTQKEQSPAPTARPAASASPTPTRNLPLHTIGQVTWHPKNYINQNVSMQGYLLKREVGYVIFSDEATGPITSHDLPVVGPGIDAVQLGQKYILEGRFIKGGLESSNKSPYHLELSNVPRTTR